MLASSITVSLLLFGITSMLVRSRTLPEHASRDLEEANRELEAFYYSVEQELRLARRIQHALLPKDLPELEGWEIAHYYRPAREVGGDFYDFLRLQDGRIALVFGDVSGKGIAAALVMANTQSVLRAAAQREGSVPGRVLAEANGALRAYVPPNTFATCFYAILDPPERPARLRKRRPRPALLVATGRRLERTWSHGDALGTDARHELRGAGGHPGGRGQPPLLQRRSGRSTRP